MAWITYATVDARWPNWERFSPYPSVEASAQTWAGYIITDAEAELTAMIPTEFLDDAAASPTPAALVSACFYQTRAKIREWFYSEKGAGTALEEDINHDFERAKEVLEAWIQAQIGEEERGGLTMARALRKDPFWQADQNVSVGADYEEADL